MTKNIVFLALVLSQFSISAFADQKEYDWPRWRGPHGDGISRETGLLKKWPEKGPKLLWQINNIGKGYSSITISGNRIFTMGFRKGKTHLICLNLKDGKRLWSVPAGKGKPNCSPTVDGDRVYGLDRYGLLTCLNVEDGSLIWNIDYKKEFGGKMMSGWGYSESPIIDGNHLICTPGAKDAVIVALDKITGKVVWKSSQPEDIGKNGNNGAGYSSIAISHAGGIKQYIQLTGKGLISVSAKDGQTLWTYNKIANNTANIPTPIIKGDFVFCSTGYRTGAALLKINTDGSGKQTAEEVYFLEAKVLQNHHGGMVLIGDYIYCGHGHNKGFPICVELATGKIAWRGGRGPGTGSAAILAADGHLYFRYENGVIALIEATPEKYNLKSHFSMATHHGRSWPHPVISNGKLYLRDQQSLLCYDISEK